jgi:hypothetical protein
MDPTKVYDKFDFISFDYDSLLAIVISDNLNDKQEELSEITMAGYKLQMLKMKFRLV